MIIIIKTYSYANDKYVRLSPHFQVWEFRSYNASRGVLTTDKILIDEDLVIMLEKLYSYLDNKYGLKAINLTSGYRDSGFEKELSGSITGYHVKGMAADIMCYKKDGSLIPGVLAAVAAEDIGIKGIGYIGNAIHVDTRTYKSYFDEVKNKFGIDSFYSYFDIKKESNEKIDNKKEEGAVYLHNNVYKGVSIVDGLKGIGIDSSYNYRSRLASINNITNYMGTAKQNTHMLNLLKNGKLIKA